MAIHMLCVQHFFYGLRHLIEDICDTYLYITMLYVNISNETVGNPGN